MIKRIIAILALVYSLLGALVKAEVPPIRGIETLERMVPPQELRHRDSGIRLMFYRASKHKELENNRYRKNITSRGYIDCSYYKYVDCNSTTFCRCWQCRDYLYLRDYY